MTALPAKNILDGSATPTTSTFKGAMGELRDFLATLMGTTGTAADARSALGVPSKADVQGGVLVCFASAGSPTAYTLTPLPAIAALAANQRFRITFHSAAGATPTLAVSGLTAKALKYRNTTGAKQAVTAAQIPSGWVADVEYDGTDWVLINTPTSGGAGATGGGTDAFIYENDQTVTTDYTITSGKNAMSAGPIEISTGITVTVPTGSTWSIV